MIFHLILFHVLIFSSVYISSGHEIKFLQANRVSWKIGVSLTHVIDTGNNRLYLLQTLIDNNQEKVQLHIHCLEKSNGSACFEKHRINLTDIRPTDLGHSSDSVAFLDQQTGTFYHAITGTTATYWTKISSAFEIIATKISIGLKNLAIAADGIYGIANGTSIRRFDLSRMNVIEIASFSNNVQPLSSSQFCPLYFFSDGAFTDSNYGTASTDGVSNFPSLRAAKPIHLVYLSNGQYILSLYGRKNSVLQLYDIDGTLLNWTFVPTTQSVRIVRYEDNEILFMCGSPDSSSKFVYESWIYSWSLTTGNVTLVANLPDSFESLNVVVFPKDPLIYVIIESKATVALRDGVNLKAGTSVLLISYGHSVLRPKASALPSPTTILEKTSNHSVDMKTFYILMGLGLGFMSLLLVLFIVICVRYRTTIEKLMIKSSLEILMRKKDHETNITLHTEYAESKGKHGILPC